MGQVNPEMLSFLSPSRIREALSAAFPAKFAAAGLTPGTGPTPVLSQALTGSSGTPKPGGAHSGGGGGGSGAAAPLLSPAGSINLQGLTPNG